MNTGAVMDSQLTMVSHVNRIGRTWYIHLRNIGLIQPNFTADAAATLVHASKLDNANSLLYGLSDKVIRKQLLI